MPTRWWHASPLRPRTTTRFSLARMLRYSSPPVKDSPGAISKSGVSPMASSSSTGINLIWRGRCALTRRVPEALPRRKSERPLETSGVVRPNLGIDEARRPLAVEGIENLLGGDPAHIFPRFPGHPGRMRARQHVIELQQRMVRRRRFLGPDVETRSSDRFVAQCFKQCAFIMDKAARRGDEIGMRLHSCEFARADHGAALFGQRTGDPDVVRAAQQFI